MAFRASALARLLIKRNWRVYRMDAGFRPRYDHNRLNIKILVAPQKPKTTIEEAY